jgi:outer membrane protein OmpA-like peptidoglycan-associated protein
MPSILKPGAAATAVLLALAGCQTAPPTRIELSAARAAYERARNDPYASRTGVLAIERAQQALRAAEQAAARPSNAVLAHHYAYLATQHAEIALALGMQAQSEEQILQASLARQRTQLEARTREAEPASRPAQGDAQASRDDAEMARRRAALFGERSSALERDLQALQAQNTQRGMVVILSDVGFDTGQARLQTGAQRSVAQLATLLKQYPERRVLIEGFTDNVGPPQLNLALSRRRAEALQRALQGAGVPQVRMETQARGAAAPVADNTTPAGRQQNRRVEVLFSDEQGEFAPAPPPRPQVPSR